MKIKKNDNVMVVAGKDRGKKGKVLRVLPEQERVVVEGVNIRKKHVRPRRQRQSGEIVEMPSPIHVSNLKLVCGKCGKGVRVGYAMEGTKKTRICKKCHAVISEA